MIIQIDGAITPNVDMDIQNPMPAIDVGIPPNQSINVSVEAPGGGANADAMDHSQLRNRGLPNQHPIAAIAGLDAALASKQPIGNYLTQESDPTVPAWAKAPNKPQYTAKEVGALSNDTKIPAKTSELTNDSGYITKEDIPKQDMEGYATEDFVKQQLTEYQPKGNYLTEEADPTVPHWAKQPEKPSYTAAEVGALPADTPIPTVPTNVSAFENDAGYLTEHQDLSEYAKKTEIPDTSEFITRTVNDLENYYRKNETYSQEEIDQRISAIPKFAIQVVYNLPTENISETTVYLVPGGAEDNLYTEFIYVSGAWEILGSQRVDLTGYATQTWTLEQLAGYQLKGDYVLKNEIPEVPKNVSAFINDVGYITMKDVNAIGIKSEIVRLSDVTLTKGALLENQIITFPTQHCNADNYICKFLISSWPKSTWTDAFVFNIHSDCTTVIGTPGTLFAYNQFGLATMATQKYDLIAQFIYYDDKNPDQQ